MNCDTKYFVQHYYDPIFVAHNRDNVTNRDVHEKFPPKQPTNIANLYTSVSQKSKQAHALAG